MIIESDTPLTDAVAKAEIGMSPISQGWYVHADFARDLERKLADAFAEQNRLNEYYQDEAIKLRRTTDERDELKRQNAMLREALLASPDNETHLDKYKDGQIQCECERCVFVRLKRAALAATEEKP